MFVSCLCKCLSAIDWCHIVRVSTWILDMAATDPGSPFGLHVDSMCKCHIRGIIVVDGTVAIAMTI